MRISHPHILSTLSCGVSLLNTFHTLHFPCLSNYITSTILVQKGDMRYKEGDKDLVGTKVEKGSSSEKDYTYNFVSLLRLPSLFHIELKN